MTATQDDPQLTEYRASIDNIDAALVHLLAERFKITKAVGRYKADAGLPPADPDRELVQVARLRALAEESGLDPAFTEEFLGSSSPRSSTTTSGSRRVRRSDRRPRRHRRLDGIGKVSGRPRRGAPPRRRRRRVGRQHAGLPRDGHRHRQADRRRAAEVRHHCIDLVDAIDEFSAADFRVAYSDASSRMAVAGPGVARRRDRPVPPRGHRRVRPAGGVAETRADVDRCPTRCVVRRARRARPRRRRRRPSRRTGGASCARWR